jgi:hypothetical protein
MSLPVRVMHILGMLGGDQELPRLSRSRRTVRIDRIMMVVMRTIFMRTIFMRTLTMCTVPRIVRSVVAIVRRVTVPMSRGLGEMIGEPNSHGRTTEQKCSANSPCGDPTSQHACFPHPGPKQEDSSE